MCGLVFNDDHEYLNKGVLVMKPHNLNGKVLLAIHKFPLAWHGVNKCHAFVARLPLRAKY